MELWVTESLASPHSLRQLSLALVPAVFAGRSLQRFLAPRLKAVSCTRRPVPEQTAAPLPETCCYVSPPVAQRAFFVLSASFLLQLEPRGGKTSRTAEGPFLELLNALDLASPCLYE